MKSELEMSASQMETAERCLARWGFERVLGIYEDECTDIDDPAVIGTEIHRQMEVYSKTGTYPEHPAAVALVESGYVPRPGIGEAEVRIAYRMPSGPFKGFIDDAYSVGENEIGPFKVPLGTTDDVQIVDYKSIGTKGKPKTVDELKANLAVNIYGWEAFLAGANRVFGLWLYVQRTAPYKVTAVHFELDRFEVEAYMTKVDAKAHELQRLYKLRVDPNKLPKDTSQCWAFNRRCPAFDACERPRKSVKLSRTLGTKKELPIMTDKDFIAHVNSITPPPAPPLPRIPPPLPPAPPSVPVAPPAPPLPTSDVQKNAAKIDESFKALFDDHLGDTPIGVPEVGFVNPPGGPSVAPRTPEEAAALQGIEPPVVHDDQLEEADLATLKTIAKTLGIELPPRTRSKAYVEAIRTARHAEAVAEDRALMNIVPPDEGEEPPVMDSVVEGLVDAGVITDSQADEIVGLEGSVNAVEFLEKLEDDEDLALIRIGTEFQRQATLMGATITLSWSPKTAQGGQ